MRFSDFKIVPILDSIRRLDIDDSVYFSRKYSKYISNSRLKYINPLENGSPGLYQHPPRISTNSLTIGSSVHELLLQKEQFFLGPKMNKPTAKLGEVADKVYNYENDGMERNEAIRKACIEVSYYVNQIDRKIPYIIEKCTPYWNALSEPRWKKAGTKEIILSDRDRDVVEACICSCYDNKQMMDLLSPTDALDLYSIESYNEIAFFIDFLVTYKDSKCTTLRFKMKADNYTVDKEQKRIVLNDVKTTGHPVTWFMNSEYGSLVKYHYFRQLALYLKVLECYCLKEYGACKESGWMFDTNFLVVQTIPDYNSKCFRLNSNWLKKGWREAEQLLKRVAAHQMFGWDTPINFE